MTKRGEPQLEPATVNWAAAFNALGGAVCLLDGEGTVQECNEALSRLLNLPRDQVLGRKCYELLRGSSTYLPDCPFLKSRQTRQRATQELALGDRFFLINVDPIFNPGGTFQGAVYTLSDITERKRLAAGLWEAEGPYRLLLDLAVDAIFTADAETGMLLDANRKAQQITGHSLEEIRRMHYTELHPPEQGSLAEMLFRAIAEHRQFVAEGLRLLGRDGRQIPVEVAANVVESGGRPISMGVFRDVTDRQQAEAALKETLDRLHDTLHAIPDLMFDVDQEGRFLDFQTQSYEPLYSKPDEFLGKTVGQVLPQEAAGVILQAIAEAAQQGWHRGATYALDLPVGRRWFELSIASRRQAPQTPPALKRFLVLARDITPRKHTEASLRQANFYNRSLIEASLDPLVTIGPDGKITDVNGSTETVTGRSRLDLIGSDFSDYFTDPEQARAGYQRVFQDGIVRDHLLEIRHRDGHRTPVLYNASLYRDENGQVVGVFAAARDVTKLKHAEESLRLSEQKLRLPVEQTPLGIIEWDTNFRVVRWNPAAVQIFGYTVAEALGQDAHFIVPPGGQADVNQKWRSLISLQQGGERSTNENVTKAGSTILCEWYNTPLTTADGTVVGVESAVWDITEQRRTERQRELEERSLQSQLRISQIQADTVGQLLDFGLAEVLDVSESELGFIQYYSEEDRVFTLHAWSKAAMQACRIPSPPKVSELEETGLWGEAVRQRRAIIVNDYPAPNPVKKGYPEGHAPLSRIMAVPVFSDGRIVAVAAVANRATEYTPQDERRVSQIMDAIWKLAERKRTEAALADAKAAAEAANRAKSEFLTNISHELRTPLHAILGMTELAMRDKLPGTVQAYLQQANDSAEVLLELLNKILDFSRTEAGRMILENVDFNLHALLDHEMKSLGLKAQQKGLELCLDVSRYVPAHLVGDPLRLRQVVTNLIGNAIKFTERGEVVVRVAVESCDAETVVLRFSVTDTGIGMSREYQKQIFDPFSQADTSTTRRYGGSGLGLSISSALVRLMGGRLDVDSELGRGSTLSFTGRFRLSSEFAEPAPLEIAFLWQLRDLRVLVVDSHSTNRQILCDTLEGWGMKPEPAGSARTALAQAQQALAAGQPFPLAIVDPDLADLDGRDLIRELRKQQGRGAATIALVSSANHQALAKRRRPKARALPLSKPVSQGELLRAIVRGLGLVPAFTLAPASTTRPPGSPRGLRILLVEDTAAGRMFATDVLQERGYTVQTAEDGRLAFEFVRDQDFDVILMDIQIPGMDGFQTTAAIRALPDPAKSRVPIVAMTAHAMLGYEQRCRAAGMDGYLSKPLRSQVLIETVERLAKPLPPAPPSNPGAEPPRQDAPTVPVDDRHQIHETL